MNHMNKNRLLVIALFLLAMASLISFNTVKQSPPPTPKAAMIADWERAKAYTLEYLSAANDDVISFKPTPDMRTFGQQMLHLSESNYGFGSAISGKTSPVTFGQLEKASDKYNTSEALTKAVMDSYDFMISALKEFDETKINETITMFNRFEMTREAGFNKAFEHQTHHRGQTTVYLRLKGIKPPNEKLL
jgi:uncharacterized damage-inducible protein DinB